jgi:hypothetical protein
MPRRTKTKKRIGKEDLEAKAQTAEKAKRPEQRWFGVFLVVLVAVLGISTLLLTTSLSASLNWSSEVETKTSPKAGGSPGKNSSSAGQIIDDPVLDFQFSVPSSFGEWIYKSGHVKSPVDDTLSNQYVQVFAALAKNAKSNSFEEKNRNILTIRRFLKEEWNKLEKGCQKDNQIYCETMGTKLAEKGDSVYAYAKAKNCPKDVEAQCRLADKIAESFRLK